MSLRLAALGSALLGTAVSAYLVWLHYSGSLALCVGFGGCEAVQTSRFAMIGPVPVAAVGLGGFATMLALATLRLRRDDAVLLLALFGASLAAVLYVLYLTYVEVFILGAVCPWCVLVALAATGVFASVAAEISRLRPA